MSASAGNGSKMSYKTENCPWLSQNLYFDEIKSPWEAYDLLLLFPEKNWTWF